MLKLTTGPASEPIDLDTAKAHLRKTTTDQDTMITSIIKAARFQFESDVPNIQLLPATWTYYADFLVDFSRNFSANVLLYKYPNVSIQSIKYFTPGNDVLQDVDPSVYALDEISFPARIYFSSVPDMDYNKYNCLQIAFTCGYDNAAAIPDDIKQALLLLIGHFYENPQAVMTGTQINELPIGYQAIVNNYKVSYV